MLSTGQNRAVWSSARNRANCLCLFLLLFSLAAPRLSRADGCFVFKWNKQIDINEPAQKAIIVHDAGREDLLLQVKYEGPLREFGWLVPVPALPKVSQGSMEPFYELSRMTQQEMGPMHGFSAGSRGGPPGVQVIEIKTVGAYEVAVLAAQDSGSLARWLKQHDYSIPEGKEGIIDDYIRQGWYFIAARINLDRPVSFTSGPVSSPKTAPPAAEKEAGLQKQLASGELHPLLISFDTPKCVFPLKISAVGGKESEVSVYVLSQNLLLNRFIGDAAARKIRERISEREQARKARPDYAVKPMRNIQMLQLNAMMYSLARTEASPRIQKDWTMQDLEAMATEMTPGNLPTAGLELSLASDGELVQCMDLSPAKIPECAKMFPRLKSGHWRLTKQVYKFKPEEMADLEFEPAIPVLAAALPHPEGRSAAAVLARLGDEGQAALLAACRSTNLTERCNGSACFQPDQQSEGLADLLLALLRDESPQVRHNAVSGIGLNWNDRFRDPLMALFRDPAPEISREASLYLTHHETADRAPVYLMLLDDPNLDVQTCALRVLARIAPQSLGRGRLLALLNRPRMEMLSLSLTLLRGERTDGPGGPMGAFMDLPVRRPRDAASKPPITSAEAAPLTTNQLILARLMSLKILRQNANADAIPLAIPMLHDTNAIVRIRAQLLLENVSGQKLADNDSAAWEKWWVAKKDSFEPRNAAK